MNDAFASQLFQVVMIVITSLGFLGSWVGTWIRDKRKRSWDLEDRRLAAEDHKRELTEIVERAEAEAKARLIETRSVAEALRVKAEEIALEVKTAVREDNRETAQILARSIKEVGASANKAYQEANHVNNKIEQLNKRLVASEKS